MADARGSTWSASDTVSIENLLASMPLAELLLAEAGWRPGMRDFQVEFEPGWALIFRDCLQVSLQLPPGPPAPLTVGGWWIDEPSPVLAALGPQVRFLYSHLVFEVGEGILRVACRSVDAASLVAGTSEADDSDA